MHSNKRTVKMVATMILKLIQDFAYLLHLKIKKLFCAVVDYLHKLKTTQMNRSLMINQRSASRIRL